MEDFDLPNNDAVDFTMESFELPDNDEVDFTPVDEAEDPGFDVSTSPLDLPLSLDLPMSPLNVRSMEMGTSLFLVGTMATLGGGVAFLRNYAAGILWGLALFALIASGLFGIGLELFWAMVGATILLLIAGMVARWVT